MVKNFFFKSEKIEPRSGEINNIGRSKVKPNEKIGNF
jgi:hypothetical protein